MDQVKATLLQLEALDVPNLCETRSDSLQFLLSGSTFCAVSSQILLAFVSCTKPNGFNLQTTLPSKLNLFPHDAASRSNNPGVSRNWKMIATVFVYICQRSVHIFFRLKSRSVPSIASIDWFFPHSTKTAKDDTTSFAKTHISPSKAGSFLRGCKSGRHFTIVASASPAFI